MGTRGKQGVHWENGLTVATLSFPLNIMTDNPGLFQLATFYGVSNANSKVWISTPDKCPISNSNSSTTEAPRYPLVPRPAPRCYGV